MKNYSKYKSYIVLVAIFFTTLYSNATYAQKSQARPAVIFGEVKIARGVPLQDDSIKLTFNERLFYSNAKSPLPLTIDVVTKNGNLLAGTIDAKTFKIEIPPFSQPGYIQLVINRTRLLDMFFIEPGDTVLMRIDPTHGQMIFGGNAADKFRVQHEIAVAKRVHSLDQDPIMRSMSATQTREKFLSGERIQPLYQEALANRVKNGYGKVLQYINPGTEEIAYLMDVYKDELQNEAQWRALERNKAELPSDFYQLIEAELVGDFLGKKVSALSSTLKYGGDTIERIYANEFSKLPINQLPDRITVLSERYINYLMSRAMVIARKEGKSMTEVVNNQYTGRVRDKVIGRFFVQYFQQLANADSALVKTVASVETPWIKEELSRLSSTQGKGAQFTDFALPNAEGDTVRLDDFKGKFVLLDFWFTGCGACKLIYEGSLIQVKEHFKGRDDFAMVSISVDRDGNLWRKSISEGEYTSAESINLTTSGFQHELLRSNNIHSYPRLILLDREGKVYRAGRLTLPPDELIAVIEKALITSNKR